MDRKNCGSCKFWTSEKSRKFRRCAWPAPAMPFLAFVGELPDHAYWLAETDGGRCDTWEVSERAASERAASERAASERAASERAASERAASERAASERAASERAASELAVGDHS